MDFYIVIFGIKVNWLAQILDLIGLTFLVIGHQKKKTVFLYFMCIANLFFVAEYALLSGWTGLIRATAAIFRNFVVISYIYRNKKTPVYWVVIFSVLVVSISAFFIDTWYAVIPPVLFVIYCFFVCQSNYKVLKYGSIGCDTAGALYNLLLGAYIGVARNLGLAAAAAVSLILLVKKERKAARDIVPKEPIK